MSTRLLADGTMLVELRGELDLASTGALRDQLSADVAAMKPSGVEVDLGLVTFMDSTALSALISTRRTADMWGSKTRFATVAWEIARRLRCRSTRIE
jgi:anti-anti-sigma factor